MLNLTHNSDLVEVACILAKLTKSGLRLLHTNMNIETQATVTNANTVHK